MRSSTRSNSILIDEARTPLIISGPLDDRSDFYNTIDNYIPRLDKADYEVDEKQRTVNLTEAGMEKMEQWLRDADLLKGNSLYDIENVSTVHHVNQGLRAHKLFQRDKDYIVRNGEVVIIDEFTGRMMPGRRYSEGLHQALEAKEHQPIQPENQTLASITFQNYFRMYDKLAGMTGTALTEADEFFDIYGLSVVEVPTNRPMIRDDQDDEVYRTNPEKYRSIITLLEECKQRGQPVLVGTTSIEKSESLAEMLRQAGWEQHDFTDPNAFAALYTGDEGAKKTKVFAILNARYHEQEAYIVSQAGVPGAITIATNMAGRGTDIQLGGNADMRIRQELADITDWAERDKDPRAVAIREQVARLKEKALKAGGLFVLGTERHESRRIDNQLRGRSGRQGDPGRSKFFLSLEDDLMRIFGSDKLDGMLTKLGLKEGEAIIHPWINKALEKAQQKVEARNFDLRKNILKYDDVANDQRKVIFDQRIDLMKDENVAETVNDMRHALIDEMVSKHIPENAYPEQWDVAGLHDAVKHILNLDLPVQDWAKEEGIADEEVLDRITKRADEHMAAKIAQYGPEVMRYVEKSILLQTLDHLWREHLVMLEHLRQVVGLRGYAQRDPLNEYKSEAFQLFEAMIANMREGVTAQLMRVEVVQAPPEGDQAQQLPYMEAHKIDPFTGEDEMAYADATLSPACRAAMAARSARPIAIRRIRRPGARSGATKPAPAAPARNTSIATAASADRFARTCVNADMSQGRAMPGLYVSVIVSRSSRETIVRRPRCRCSETGRQTMQIPLEISFHNVEHSDWAEDGSPRPCPQAGADLFAVEILPRARRAARRQPASHHSAGGAHRARDPRPQGDRGRARAGTSAAEISTARSAQRDQRGVPDRHQAIIGAEAGALRATSARVLGEDGLRISRADRRAAPRERISASS